MPLFQEATAPMSLHIMVLNQSHRDSDFNFRTECIPVRLQDREDLLQAKATDPWIWSWKDGHICREHRH